MRVAIAGGGIAGLTAALALAQRGFSVEIFERSPQFDEIGAGIQLSPNAMAVLDRLGLARELHGLISEPRAIQIHQARSGARLTSIPLGAIARRRYGAPYGLIHRADLQAALLGAVERQTRVTLRLGSEVRDVGGGEEEATFSAGGQRLSADILVAADGVHSRLRTGFFGHPGPRPLHRTAWRATIPIEAAPSGISRHAVGLWLGSGVHLVHYPLRAGTSLNIVVIGRAADPSVGPPATLFGSPLQELIAAAPEWTTWPLLDIDPEWSWVKGRAVLVGDAAHAMPPSAAQGGAQAIEDAWTLASCLAEKRPSVALGAFEQARRQRVRRVTREARRNLALYGVAGLPARLRDAAIYTLPAQLHLRRLDWLYGWKPG